jgi:signal transduction histidine kinase
VVDQACAAVSALFETSGLELRKELEATGPVDARPTVIGDPHRLVQVVINLLSNAVKFTASGSVTVLVATSPVGGGAEQVVVSVTDTGTGIAAADRERVFEAFAQAGDTLTDKPRGTGLGLSISREIVEERGGRLWLESELGQGSTFSFALPIVAPANEPAAAG